MRTQTFATSQPAPEGARPKLLGIVNARSSVLVASDGGSRRVSSPVRRDDVTLSGDGWTFKAAPGWVIREGARPGDYEVVRQQR